MHSPNKRLIYAAKPYQDFGTEHIIDKTGAGCFIDMGLGKTVLTLTAIDRLINDLFMCEKSLIIAPKKVAESTWPAEIEKWQHLKNMTYSLVLGSEAERIAALRKKADVYIINRENVVWLVGFYGTAFPFDFVCIDESSSFKNPQAKRFKALKRILPLIKRVVLLSGTPMPKSLIDLWPQLFLLDQGERLGKTITEYRNKYFNPGRRNGPVIFEYNVKKEKDEFLGEDYYIKLIHEKIADICISMKSEDWLTLPDRVDRFVNIRLSSETRAKYDEFERLSVLAMGDIDLDDITAVNAAVLSGKLLQFTSGAIYTDKPNYYEVHDEKIEALEEILEAANGHPVLVFYNFAHDLERIMTKLKKYKPRKNKTDADIVAWNNKEIPLFLIQPQSGAWGLNLQAGGNIIVWFGVPWSSELYEQGNKRIHRQGQTEKVIVHHLICEGTVDDDVVLSLDDKIARQNKLLAAIKARVSKYKR